ncbi:MAG TPA: hydantoinase B/oxoprolinase family protein [Caulobacteraceae bacterium]|jgi:5-oxoprolinase (ATP-hydrolysing)|nr:hydantoinase B/oxoprolinase family protein [Caulobacteraceae bacterium]
MPPKEASAQTQGWSFWIDRGGTFTDVVARAPDGRMVVRKLLSEDPGRYADAAVAAIRAVLDEAGQSLASARIEAVKMGTTVATNALLERQGEATVLAITRGFGDALAIGYQNRPRLFDRRIVKPQPLHAAVVEIDERMSADGEVLRPLDLPAARGALQAAYDRGLRAVAVVLMHGYRHPEHERRIAVLAREIGFSQVSVSHEVSSLIKLVGRGDTTVADAYLSPILRRYVDRAAAALPPGARLLFMQSSGGLTDAHRFRGADAVLSGPAGGIVGMARTAMEAGFGQVVGFDMGGTSTDVSHFAGEYERTTDSVVAGVRLRAPMLAIHTVAAGGGSICRFDGARLRVGPASAGARPGPASYRNGGPLTVTDCNLVLGKILPEHFPAVFGPEGDLLLDRGAAHARLQAVAEAVAAATGRPMAPADLAEGFVRIAVEAMAKAVKQISVERGYDLDRYALASFGGAGGQHACLVADALGIDTVMIHPLAGVLSAYGMGCADVGVVREVTVEAWLDGRALDVAMDELQASAVAALDAQALTFGARTVHRRARLKYEGTDTALQVPFGDPAAMGAAFEALHLRRFGFTAPGRALVVEALSVEAVGEAGAHAALPPAGGRGPAVPLGRARVRMDGADLDAPVFDRTTLAPGAEIDGPAIVVEATATTAVEPGWRGRIDGRGNLILARVVPRRRLAAAGTAVDPIRLELFNSLFMAVAEEMGAALQSTAYSVNIKERLDFSCALFDRAGALVANAPHIPVHLGSMGASVQAVMRGRAKDGRGVRPGDVYMLNDPYNGGTHLPDVTVIAPVFGGAGDEGGPLFWVAARGHQADIGGVTPGSMPPRSRSLAEEGILIDDVLLVEAGRLREAEVRALLASGRWPARNPDQNLGDLKAQVAACAKGAAGLRALVDAYGRAAVEAYMGHVQDNAEEAVRRVLSSLKGGAFTVETDTGAMIRVRIEVDRAARSAVVDFTGTSAQQADNFNAPLSVTRAALLYVLRTLVEDEIPLNDGCLRPVRLIVPEGSMLNPLYPAAVVAGNVETSQAVVDALYGALGVLAASQGSMNNLTFGDRDRQYYETIAGGAGAGPGFDGADAVQTHMTNSRLTDPEVLEARFPILVDRFAIRRGSGGEGEWRGGDGTVRRISFREPMTAAILSSRRRVAPFGLAGGSPGLGGRNAVERADGSVEELGSTAVVEMAAGDAFVVETPGGGGYGPPRRGR